MHVGEPRNTSRERPRDLATVVFDLISDLATLQAMSPATQS